MLNESDIVTKIKLAENATKDVDPNLREFAFKEVLNFFLWSNAENQPYVGKMHDLTEARSVKDKLSLPEIFAAIKPKPHTDKAIIIAYFLFQYEEIDTFNGNQVIEKLTKVRAAKPSNMTDTLNGLIKRGFLREGSQVDGKKGFEITQKGIEYVESLFSNMQP